MCCDRYDNGPESTSETTKPRAAKLGIEIAFMQPGQLQHLVGLRARSCCQRSRSPTGLRPGMVALQRLQRRSP